MDQGNVNQVGDIDLTINGQTQGDILYFNGTSWLRLAPGTADQSLRTGGAGANPAWETVDNATDLSIASQTTGDMLYYNGANWVRLAGGTSGDVLTANGAGVAPTYQTPTSGGATFAAGDYIIARDDNFGKISSGTVLAKKKEIVVNGDGTLRIKFDIRSHSVGGSQVFRIYRNGGAVGTQRTASASWVTWSEDIAGWSVGDTCELWGRKDVGGGGANVWFRRLRLYSDTPFSSERITTNSVGGYPLSTSGYGAATAAVTGYLEIEVNGTVYKMCHNGTL